ncbi:MAG: hypothetical protein ACREDI_12205, partial [Roseiarcus sp.]
MKEICSSATKVAIRVGLSGAAAALAVLLATTQASASVTLLLAAGGGGGSAYADPYGPSQTGGEGLVSGSGGGAPGFT